MDKDEVLMDHDIDLYFKVNGILTILTERYCNIDAVLPLAYDYPFLQLKITKGEITIYDGGNLLTRFNLADEDAAAKMKNAVLTCSEDIRNAFITYDGSISTLVLKDIVSTKVPLFVKSKSEWYSVRILKTNEAGVYVARTTDMYRGAWYQLGKYVYLDITLHTDYRRELRRLNWFGSYNTSVLV